MQNQFYSDIYSSKAITFYDQLIQATKQKRQIKNQSKQQNNNANKNFNFQAKIQVLNKLILQYHNLTINFKGAEINTKNIYLVQLNQQQFLKAASLFTQIMLISQEKTQVLIYQTINITWDCEQNFCSYQVQKNYQQYHNLQQNSELSQKFTQQEMKYLLNRYYNVLQRLKSSNLRFFPFYERIEIKKQNQNKLSLQMQKGLIFPILISYKSYDPDEYFSYNKFISLLQQRFQLKFVSQITQNLKQLHFLGIQHRDIRMANIMFSLKDFRFKLIDFDSSALIERQIKDFSYYRFLNYNAYWQNFNSNQTVKFNQLVTKTKDQSIIQFQSEFIKSMIKNPQVFNKLRKLYFGITDLKMFCLMLLKLFTNLQIIKQDVLPSNFVFKLIKQVKSDNKQVKSDNNGKSVIQVDQNIKDKFKCFIDWELIKKMIIIVSEKYKKQQPQINQNEYSLILHQFITKEQNQDNEFRQQTDLSLTKTLSHLSNINLQSQANSSSTENKIDLLDLSQELSDNSLKQNFNNNSVLSIGQYHKQSLQQVFQLINDDFQPQDYTSRKDLFKKKRIDYQKNIQDHLQSLDVQKKIYGDSHQQFIKTMNLLGETYYLYGDYTKSLNCFQQIIQMYSLYHKERDQLFIRTNNDIGAIHYINQQFDAAMQCFQQNLIIWKQKFDTKHQLYATFLKNAGYICLKQLKYQSAQFYIIQSLQIQEKLNDLQPEKIANTCIHFIQLYCELRQFEKSQFFLQKATKYVLLIQEENHPTAANLYSAKGKLRYEQQRYIEALQTYQVSQNIYQQLLQSKQDYPERVQTHFQIGCVYIKLQNNIKAQYQFNKCLQLTKKRVGENHVSYTNLLQKINKIRKQCQNISLNNPAQ